VLTAYESQRRLTRNYLEGARRKRISYTPKGLWEAWVDLDAAMKVYVGSIAGFVLSVSTSNCSGDYVTNNHSSFQRSYCSLALAAFTATMASLARRPATMVVAEGSNGKIFSLTHARLLLTILQDSIHLRTAFLDSHCWALDLMEDPSYQGRALLGLADEAGDPRGVCTTPCILSAVIDHSIAYPEPLCGLHLLFRTSEAYKASTTTSRRLDGKSTLRVQRTAPSRFVFANIPWYMRVRGEVAAPLAVKNDDITSQYQN
jgi:hypothetical protein